MDFTVSPQAEQFRTEVRAVIRTYFTVFDRDTNVLQFAPAVAE